MDPESIAGHRPRIPAAAGIAGCILAALTPVALLAWGFFNFAASMRDGACHDSGEYLGIALSMYAADYDDRLPPASHWADVLFPYTRADIPCTTRPKAKGPYAFNAALDRSLLAKVDAQAPMLFESNAGRRNHADLLESFTQLHKGKGWVVLGGGEVRSFAAPPDAKFGQ